MSKYLTQEQVRDLATRHGGGVPVGLLAAVAEWESGFDPLAESDKGAVGLMQIMRVFHPKAKLEDPAVSMQIGAQVLAGSFYLLNHIRAGNIRHDAAWHSYPWHVREYTVRALAGYNMGPGNVMWYDGHPDHAWPESVGRYSAGIWSIWQNKG